MNYESKQKRLRSLSSKLFFKGKKYPVLYVNTLIELNTIRESYSVSVIEKNKLSVDDRLNSFCYECKDKVNDCFCYF